MYSQQQKSKLYVYEILTSISVLELFLSVITIDANMGRKRVVVAVLLEHSVNKAISIDSRMEMAKGGIFCSGVRLFPSHSERPESCEGMILMSPVRTFSKQRF